MKITAQRVNRASRTSRWALAWASAGAVALGLPVAAQAQTAPAQSAGVGVGIGDIVVTARREAENLQDVPVSVQVVTSDQIQKLALTSVVDIAKLAPGLTLVGGGGSGETVILRGVRWTAFSGTPAIPIYLDESSFDPAVVLQTLYDVGQIEVLRGPQGTARGAPSISGAVTITTRRPDLDSMGGYVSGMLGTRDHRNVQGAINIPIIPDKLAVRIAGAFERSNGNGVRSLINPIDPFSKSWSGRISVRYEPTDNLHLDLMYQKLRSTARQYNQAVGTGSPGKVISPLLPPAFGGGPSITVPANYNSPALSLRDRKSVDAYGADLDLRADLFVANASWEFAGQQLSYIYGYQRSRSLNIFGTDPSNSVVGDEPVTRVNSLQSHPYFYNHELRLSSVRGDHLFDYDVGAYYHKSRFNPLTYDTFGGYLPGAFGAPFVAASNPVVNPAAAQRYQVPVHIDIDGQEESYSFYGNVELHLPYDIEFTGGVRWNHAKRPYHSVTRTLAGQYAAPRFLPAALGGCPSAALPSSPIYGATFCEVPVPSQLVSDDNYDKTITPTIYNVSLSKKLSDDVLIYATVGSSFRVSVPNIGNTGFPTALLSTGPEKATSYEAGVKTTLFNRRVRFNADVFQIDYKGQLTQYSGISYYNTVTGNISQPQPFLVNNDARVRGVEVELGMEPFRNFNLNANLSYTKITSGGGQGPCTDASRPLNAANPINYCALAKGDTLNGAAPFQASVNGSYTVSFDKFDGYLRFVVNHQGNNPNYGISTYKARQYTIVDLFAGVTGNKGGWDIGAYAKNVFNVQRLLTQRTMVPQVADFGPTGLSGVTTTTPREIGVQLRYSFGSR